MPPELSSDELLRDIEIIGTKPEITQDDVRVLTTLQASLNRQKFAKALSPHDEKCLNAATQVLERHGIFTED